MNETLVVEYIKKWLQKSGRFFDEDYAVDFLVMEHESNHWLKYLEGIECKGTKSDFHRAVGQCLDYHFVYDGIPIYLAIPEDYISLVPLEKTLDYFKLPIGIMLVDELGNVSEKKEARGKIRCYKEYLDEDLYVHKFTHPKLHFVTK